MGRKLPSPSSGLWIVVDDRVIAIVTSSGSMVISYGALLALLRSLSTLVTAIIALIHIIHWLVVVLAPLLSVTS